MNVCGLKILNNQWELIKLKTLNKIKQVKSSNKHRLNSSQSIVYIGTGPTDFSPKIRLLIPKLLKRTISRVYLISIKFIEIKLYRYTSIRVYEYFKVWSVLRLIFNNFENVLIYHLLLNWWIPRVLTMARKQ